MYYLILKINLELRIGWIFHKNDLQGVGIIRIEYTE
jgi:hypothetical protein